MLVRLRFNSSRLEDVIVVVQVDGVRHVLHGVRPANVGTPFGVVSAGPLALRLNVLGGGDGAGEEVIVVIVSVQNGGFFVVIHGRGLDIHGLKVNEDRSRRWSRGQKPPIKSKETPHNSTMRQRFS